MEMISESWPAQPLKTHLSVFIHLPGKEGECFIRLCTSSEYLTMSRCSDTPPTPVSKTSNSFEKLSNVRVEKYESLPRMSPSELGRPERFFHFQKEHKNFYVDRPMASSYEIPPTLLHPVFGEFLDDCEAHKPSPDDYMLARDLVYGMSQYFPDERHRVDKFCEILGKYGIQISGTKLENHPTSYKTDGDIQEGEFRFVILEAKNEIGEGGAEPLLQAMWYYQHSVGGTNGAKMQIATYPNSRLPCLLLCVFGLFPPPFRYSYSLTDSGGSRSYDALRGRCVYGPPSYTNPLQPSGALFSSLRDQTCIEPRAPYRSFQESHR